ncbi:MAG: VCBS repeat-containing protein [Pseudomonadota bacterium]
MKKVVAFLSVLVISAFTGEGRADNWVVSEIASPPSSLFVERCRRGDSQLPDGCTTRANGDVSAAWYEEPTDRYAHAILGDAIEAGTLAVRTSQGSTARLRLPSTEVFEDRFPRIVDLDRDGTSEIVTIRSSSSGGGSVAVYGVRGGALREIASTRFIGRANRWLNIAGIDDFIGDGSLQIAFVETPHIGGTLKLAQYRGNSLRVVAQAGGFSNHQIRSPVMDLSAVADFNGDGRLDLAVPDASRTALRVVTFTAGGVRDLATIPLPGAVVQPFELRDELGGKVLYLGLSSGQVVSVRHQAN